jgi:hypothetical protein
MIDRELTYPRPAAGNVDVPLLLDHPGRLYWPLDIRERDGRWVSSIDVLSWSSAEISLCVNRAVMNGQQGKGYACH